MSDDIVARLRAVLHNDRSVELMNREAANEIERLRKERDEARREVCNNEANHLPTMSDPYREAKRRGWVCFKEKDK